MWWSGWRKVAFVCAGIVVACAIAAVALDALLALGRPPQPLSLGTIQWTYEVGATVDSVERRSFIGAGRDRVRAKGVFYIVHARILAPFGVRPTWNDSDVSVDTYGHTGATLPPMHFTVDERAQAVLDRLTHRPGAVHEVRGAQQREDLVFDLPQNVEQPALVFLPANDPSNVINALFGDFWQPHRFNLRYD